MAKNLPIKQHTVPNTYLLGFADSKGFTWVYDREAKELRNQPTKDTTIEKDFYTFTRRDGTKLYTMEKMFADLIESKFKTIVSKLEKEEQLTPEEYGYLGAFATFQWLRTTASRRDFDHSTEEFAKFWMRLNFRTPEDAKRSLDRYEKGTGKKLGVTPEEAVKFAHGNFKVKVPQEYHIKHMATAYDELYKELFNLNWLVLKARANDYFVTSDNPFWVQRRKAPPFVPQHLSIGEITLPLTSKMCLYMHEKGRAFGTMFMNKEEVRKINSRTIYSSDRFIISRKRSDLVELVKYSKIDSIPRKPAVVLDTPF